MDISCLDISQKTKQDKGTEQNRTKMTEGYGYSGLFWKAHQLPSIYVYEESGIVIES